MDEFALIEKFFTRQPTSRSDVKLGIGDDAAVTVIDAGFDLVIATDTIIVDTHFPASTDAHAIGHRCLAVNLSDLAAMGAEPLWCTLALSLPSGDADWVAAFVDGFFELARCFDIALIGGDTVQGPLAITVTVHGRVKSGEYIPRSGAGSADGIYVTGNLGASAAGLRHMDDVDHSPAEAFLIHRFLYPDPRVKEAQSLFGLATAMIDISDGLHVDLTRMLHASGVGADLDIGQIPLSPELLTCMTEEAALELALTGGDDYELCFAVPIERETELQALLSSWDCRLTRIGQTHSSPEIVWTYDGQVYTVPDTSFRHF
ncbi:MAG: thiamine-phosphate kinase [Gammaproteobacteria bacterium]|nr:thiamine-phosphate kinase [Gammaproteobacteria bacterium]